MSWRDILQPHELDPHQDAPQPPAPASFQPGRRVFWNSPLFGDCHGIIVMVEGGRLVVSNHSITGGTVSIPVDWATRLEL